MSLIVSLKHIFHSYLTLDFRAPPSQVMIGCGYKCLVDMFNGAQDLIDVNDWKDELLDSGANIDDRDIFDSE